MNFRNSTKKKKKKEKEENTDMLYFDFARCNLLESISHSLGYTRSFPFP